MYPAIPIKKLALILRFAEGKKEPLSRKNLGKAARNALGKGTGPLNLPGTAVGIFLSGLQKWAQKSPEVVETSELFCVGIYFGAPSCVFRTLWITVALLPIHTIKKSMGMVLLSPQVV